jgi:hypothetical protein
MAGSRMGADATRTPLLAMERRTTLLFRIEDLLDQRPSGVPMVVGEDVAQVDDASPGDLRSLGLEPVAQPVDGFADDPELANKRRRSGGISTRRSRSDSASSSPCATEPNTSTCRAPWVMARRQTRARLLANSCSGASRLTGCDQSYRRSHCRDHPPLFVTVHCRLRRAGSAGQLGLRQPSSQTRRPGALAPVTPT